MLWPWRRGFSRVKELLRELRRHRWASVEYEALELVFTNDVLGRLIKH